MVPAILDVTIPESQALTGLRGVAAVLVVMHHVSFHLGAADMLLVGGLLRRGYLGVDLFFVLSGFVISMVYGGWFAGEQKAAVAGAPDDRATAVAVFLVRRAARVWPLHAAVLATLLAWMAWQGGPMPSSRFTLANVMMVQGWGLSGEVNVPAWSVSTEFLAYLLFPVLAPTVLRGRWGGWLGLAVVAALLAACLALAPEVGPGRRGLLDIHYNDSVLPAMRCLAGFLLGMLAWRAGHVATVARWAGRPWAGPGALLLALGLLLAGTNDLLVLALLPVVVVGMHHGRGWAWRVFTVQPVHGLGLLSYAIYLVHYALMPVLLDGPLPVAVRVALYAAATLLLAIGAHGLIERPTRRFVRWLGEAVVGTAAGPALARLGRRGAWRG